MSKVSSMSRLTASSPEVASASASDAPSSIDAEDPEFIAALGCIVSAFVDLGFGVSADQQACQAANDNRDLVRIAADFPQKASRDLNSERKYNDHPLP